MIEKKIMSAHMVNKHVGVFLLQFTSVIKPTKKFFQKFALYPAGLITDVDCLQ